MLPGHLTCRLIDLSTVLPVERSSIRVPLSVSTYTPLLPTGWPGAQGASRMSTKFAWRCCLRVTCRAVRLRPLHAASPLLAPPLEERLRMGRGLAQLSDHDCRARAMQDVCAWKQTALRMLHRQVMRI